MVDDDRSHQSLLFRLKSGVLGVVRSGLRTSADILFPASCIGCRIQVSEPGTLCPHCWSQLRFIEKPYCPVLGIPFNHDFGENFMSAEAIAISPPALSCVA
jgi:predicted amidophosphoribosyltransferase